MKIICGPGGHDGCGFMRIYWPYMHLPEHTVRFTDIAQPAMWCEYDLAVVQRVSTPDMLFMLEQLKAHNVPVIMDFDDNIHAMTPDNPASTEYGTGKPMTNLFEKALGMVDIVTASTADLAKEYARFRPDIVVCENFLLRTHIDEFAPAAFTGAPKREGEVRIGYAAGIAHTADLFSITKPLRKVFAQYPEAKLVLFGMEIPWGRIPAEFQGRIEFHLGMEPGDDELPTDYMRRYYAKVASLDLDIGLAPLTPSVFNKCRSFLKALEYGMLGVPVVATRFGPFRDYENRGGSILTCGEDRDWIANIGNLIRNEELRGRMAQMNFRWVSDNHTEETAMASWRKVLEKVGGAGGELRSPSPTTV